MEFTGQTLPYMRELTKLDVSGGLPENGIVKLIRFRWQTWLRKFR